MRKYIDIEVAVDADADDCLAAAEASYIEEHPELEGYDLSARWTDDGSTITLTVPGNATLVEAGDGWPIPGEHVIADGTPYLVVGVGRQIDTSRRGNCCAALLAEADWDDFLEGCERRVHVEMAEV